MGYFISETRKHALASRVLAVAVITWHIKEPEDQKTMIDWSCYIDAVKGVNHEIEKMVVSHHGDKASKEIACVLFPCLPKDKYRA